MQEAGNAILHASQSYTMLMCLNDLIVYPVLGQLHKLLTNSQRTHFIYCQIRLGLANF